MAVSLHTPVVPHVLRQHGEEIAGLYVTRAFSIAAPHVASATLRRLDDRLAAHVRGLSLGGEERWAVCDGMLESPTDGAMFAVTIQAVGDNDLRRLDGLSSLAPGSSKLRRALVSALGWVDASRLRDLAAALMRSPDPVARTIALDAYRLHRADVGAALVRQMSDADDAIRARAVRTAGELGRRDLLSSSAAAMAEDGSDCTAWAARSAVLLGDRGKGLDALIAIGLTEGVHRARAFSLALQAMSPGAAHAVLVGLNSGPEPRRRLIQGSGIAGDPSYAPWLIGEMRNPLGARLAGEAFALITGADLAAEQLDTQRPENLESGPTDDPDDPNVDMDLDEGLPWPDPDRVQRWWDANQSRFARGQSYFMGAPVTREHCIEVLKNGYQRQRILAAHYLCLLEPGTPLFNTSAPAWRQQRLLAEMH